MPSRVYPSATVTWSGTTSATAAWTGNGLALAAPSWELLKSVRTTVDIGVDFRRVFGEQYPWYFWNDRGGVLVDTETTP